MFLWKISKKKTKKNTLSGATEIISKLLGPLEVRTQAKLDNRRLTLKRDNVRCNMVPGSALPGILFSN